MNKMTKLQILLTFECHLYHIIFVFSVVYHHHQLFSFVFVDYDDCDVEDMDMMEEHSQTAAAAHLHHQGVVE